MLELRYLGTELFKWVLSQANSTGDLKKPVHWMVYVYKTVSFFTSTVTNRLVPTTVEIKMNWISSVIPCYPII